MKLVLSLWQETILTLPKKGFKGCPDLEDAQATPVALPLKSEKLLTNATQEGPEAELVLAANFNGELLVAEMFNQRTPFSLEIPTKEFLCSGK